MNVIDLPGVPGSDTRSEAVRLAAALALAGREYENFRCAVADIRVQEEGGEKGDFAECMVALKGASGSAAEALGVLKNIIRITQRMGLHNPNTTKIDFRRIGKGMKEAHLVDSDSWDAVVTIISSVGVHGAVVYVAGLFTMVHGATRSLKERFGDIGPAVAKGGFSALVRQNLPGNAVREMAALESAWNRFRGAYNALCLAAAEITLKANNNGRSIVQPSQPYGAKE